MKHGLLLIDKPQGISSAQALNVIKKRLKPGKIGHAGTLDPMATGLLIVLTGYATRLADYVQAGEKEYSGTIRFGLVTSTDDITGDVIRNGGGIPPYEAVVEAAKEFTGEISQVPPQVSAVKVDGERAYKLSRRGEQVELKSRLVTVGQFDLGQSEDGDYSFHVRCSKGTYIRSLARDLGEKIGCGACLSALRRESSYPFSTVQAKLPDEISWEDLIPWDQGLPGAQKLFLPAAEARLIRAGNETALKAAGKKYAEPERGKSVNGNAALEKLVIYYDESTGEAFGLLERVNGSLNIVFNLPDRGDRRKSNENGGLLEAEKSN